MKSKEIKKVKESLGALKDKAVPASEIVLDYFKEQGNKTISMVNKLRRTIGEVNDQISTKTDWITQIEDYCNSENIMPNDLILFHKEYNGKIKLKSALKAEIKPNQDRSNFMSDLQKKKCGL